MPLSLDSPVVGKVLAAFCAFAAIALIVAGIALSFKLNATLSPGPGRGVGFEAGAYTAGDGLQLAADGTLSLAPIAGFALLGNAADDSAVPGAVGPLGKDELLVGGSQSLPNSGADGVALTVGADSVSLGWEPLSGHLVKRNAGTFVLTAADVVTATGQMVALATQPALMYIEVLESDMSEERPLWCFRLIANFSTVANIKDTGRASIDLSAYLPDNYKQVFPSSIDSPPLVVGTGWAIKGGGSDRRFADVTGSATTKQNQLDLALYVRGSDLGQATPCFLMWTVAFNIRLE